MVCVIYQHRNAWSFVLYAVDQRNLQDCGPGSAIKERREQGCRDVDLKEEESFTWRLHGSSYLMALRNSNEQATPALGQGAILSDQEGRSGPTTNPKTPWIVPPSTDSTIAVLLCPIGAVSDPLPHNLGPAAVICLAW